MTALRLISSRHHRYGEQLRFLRSFAACALQASGERSAIWYWHGHDPRCLAVREMPDGLEVVGEEAVARRVRDHLDAGADHVAIQVLEADPSALPVRAWKALAEALLPD